MRTKLLSALIGLLLWTAGTAQAVPIREGTPAVIVPSSFTVGWKFHTNTAITITAVDLFDPAGGFVLIYDENRILLKEAIVSPSDPVVGSPIAYHSHAITPLTLPTGGNFIIVQAFSGSSLPNPAIITDAVTDPAITYLGGVSGDGFFPTSDLLTLGRFGGYLAANFELAGTETADVVEPASLSVMIAGLGGLLAARRRRRAAI